jgi:hypothetical protein
MGKWIGVDLDGTLAEHSATANNGDGIGKPIPPMLKRVREWGRQGVEVRIFTARAGSASQVNLIREWLRGLGLAHLTITNIKDTDMMEHWDDRAVRVQRNTGKVCPSCEKITSGNHSVFSLTDC